MNFSTAGEKGWPKLALSTFMGWKEGLASVILAPSVVSCQIGEAHVTCRLETDYPFRDTLTYTVTTDRPARFPLGIRIPGTVASAVVDGAQAQPGAFFTVERDWSGTQQVQVSFTMETKLERRPNDLYCVKRGPLLYAVAIQEEWTRLEYTQNGVERKYPYCDYEIRPLSPGTTPSRTTASPWRSRRAGTRPSPQSARPFPSPAPSCRLTGALTTASAMKCRTAASP